MSEWIRVKDELPRTNDLGIAHVLVYDKMEGVVAADFLDESAKADVQEVKSGCWSPIMMSEATGWDLSLTGGHDEVCEYQCSVCGKSNILDEFGEVFLPPYCPWCGAKLKDV